MMNPGYTLLMIAAVATGAWLSRRTQASLPLTPRERLGVGLGAFCGAMIGAKLPFVMADWQGLLSGAAWFADGKTILCGLVGGYLGVEIAKWALDIHAKTGDSFAVPVAAAIGVGRMACFAGGCCYGTPTDLPWGVVFATADALPRHPTQLYEAAFHLAAAAMLWRIQNLAPSPLWGGLGRRLKRELASSPLPNPPHQGEGTGSGPGAYPFRGQLIKLYILAYLGYRFATEFIRPEARLAAGLTGYQGACLALAPLFVFLWRRDAKTVISGSLLVEKESVAQV